MENNKDLEEFRKQWKYELNRNKLPVDEKPKRPNHSSDDRSRSSNCDTDTDKTKDFHHPGFGVEESKKRPNTYQSFLLAEDLLKQDDSQIHETYSSNVLRRKRSSCDMKDLNSSSTSSQDVGLSPEPKVPKSDDKNTAQPKERFLDIFLADLDEINEIPFFDIELPRELALKIFRHLDVAELCHCAQVSRAWRSLAEDEVLWLQLSHQYGYNMENRSTDDLNWKSIFREKQVRQQNLTANWKSRTGTFHQYSYPGGGVLCAVHSHQDYIVAGYTSGEVKFWNTGNAEQCLFQASCRALEINEDEDAGTSTNYVTCVRTNHNVTAAGYSQGYVDVWSNETGTSPVHSFRGPGSVNQVELSQSGDQLLAVNDNIIRVEHTRDGQWTQQRMFELPTKVTQADFIENCASTNSSNYVATACEDRLTIYNTRNDDVTIVHNTIGQRVTIFDVNDAEILYGTIWYMEPIAKIEVYDFSIQRHTCRVNAHAGPVTCLNLRDSPQHMFVTGGLDRKAMIHDRRISATVMTFNRLNSVPNQVQMDDYKVVCGLDDGMVCVYDQRTTNKLWEFHNRGGVSQHTLGQTPPGQTPPSGRHPVKYLYFKDNLLTTANIPNLKFPHTQPFEEVDNIKHRRYRGNIQLYDFLGEQKTQGVHDICLSTYDEPEQYSYNIRLAVPYDQL